MRALVGASVIWVLVVSATVWSVIQHQVDELADAGLQESGAGDRLVSDPGDSVPGPDNL